MDWKRLIFGKNPVVQSSRGRQERRRFLAAEPLEPRHLMAVTVFLDFGAASGDNSFQERLQELTQIDGQAFTPQQISDLRANITSAVGNAYSGWDVSFTETEPTGDFETISFGRTKDFVFDAPEGFGQAELDWLNINHLTNEGEATAYVFPVEFTKANLGNPAPAAYLNRLGNALAYWGIHELGHAFGLEDQDAFGDPSIMPEQYANTLGVQNRNFMAVPSFGLAPAQFDALDEFAFSPLSRVKLGLAARLSASPLPTSQETTSEHASAATAQQLVFASLPSASAQAVDVELASTSDEPDFYKFDLLEGELLTVATLATNVYEHTLDPSEPFSFDTVIRLIKPDGTTLVMSADDIKTGVNKYGNIAGTTLLDQDSQIVNFRVPAGAGGTYFVEVTSKALTPGFYDLLVAKWTPTLLPWQNPVGNVRDVTNDGLIVARDALRVINEINRVGGGGRRLPNPLVGAENPVIVVDGVNDYFYFDVSGDDFVTAIDALQIINHLNSTPAFTGGEGEAEELIPSGDRFTPALPASSVDASFAAASAWWGMEEMDAAKRKRS